jgi:bla regulator protein blaR1
VETLYRAGLSNALSATFLAVLVACLGRVLARRPAVLHCLWLLVLVKLVTPPMYELPVPWPEPLRPSREPAATRRVVFIEPVEQSERYAAAASEAVLPKEHSADKRILVLDNTLRALADQPSHELSGVKPYEWSSIDWMRLASGIWIGGALTTFAVSIRRIRRFQHLLHDAHPVCEDTQEWVDELAANLGLLRSPTVWWVGGTLSPLVWSLGWRPRLIIPIGLWKGLDDRQRATLIIHELAHLRRGDHHLRFFELIVTALFWWHPVLWWARHSLRDVEERCCDAWVVWAYPEAAKAYAETLLETLDFLNNSEPSEPLLASGFGKVHHLRKRLTMIMNGTTPRLLGVWGTLGSLGLAAVLLPVNATWAQKPEERKEVTIIVRPDDGAAEPTEAVATIEGAAVNVITNVVATTDEDGKPAEVRVEVKTDDSSDKVVADSLDQAIKKIKEQIEIIQKETKPGDQQRIRVRALEDAVRQLENTGRKTKALEQKAKSLEQLTVKKEETRRAIVDRIGKIEEIRTATLTPEKKAEIDKARSKVKELADALRAKQKELAEAQAKLSKLQADTHLGVNIIKDNPLDMQLQKQVIRLRDLSAKPATPAGSRYTVIRDGDSDKKRLEELEKKLDKLLDEVATLKKDRAK